MGSGKYFIYATYKSLFNIIYQENDSNNSNKMKASGPSIIVIEMIKAAGNEMITQITHFANQINFQRKILED